MPGTPADCASLGISGKLFDGVVPDLVSFEVYLQIYQKLFLWFYSKF